MKLRWLTTAALSLGVSAFVPSFAKADRVDRDFDHRDGREVKVEKDVRIERDGRFDGRFDRDGRDRDQRPIVERRVVERPIIRQTVIEPNFNTVIDCEKLPPCVLDTVNQFGNGRRISWVRYERNHGETSYVIGMLLNGKQDLFLHVTPDGRLLQMDRGALRDC